MKTRVDNKQKLERTQDAILSAPKRRRIDDRYPPIDSTAILDQDAHKRNLDALQKEMAKPKPVKTTVLQLMMETFGCTTGIKSMKLEGKYTDSTT